MVLPVRYLEYSDPLGLSIQAQYTANITPGRDGLQIMYPGLVQGLVVHTSYIVYARTRAVPFIGSKVPETQSCSLLTHL